MASTKISKTTARTFRALAETYPDKEELVGLFYRLKQLAAADIGLFSRAEWRALVGLHERGNVPAAPTHPLILGSAGRRIARYMRAANKAATANSPTALGENIFTEDEISQAEWSEVG